MEDLAHLVVDAFLDQLQRMRPVPGSRQHGGIRKLAAHQPGDPRGDLLLVRGNHHRPRRIGPGGLQDVQPRAVAEPDLEAEGLGRADHLGIVVDDVDRHPPRQQGLAGDLPEPPEADDQDLPLQPLRRLHPLQRHFRRSGEAVVQDHHDRRQRHRDDDDRIQDRRVLGTQQPHRKGRGIQHKGKLAALRHQNRPLQRLGMVGLVDPRHKVDDQRLQHHKRDDTDRDQPPVVGDHRQFQRHAHRQEEQAEKDTPERLHIRLKLVPEGGFRQQNPGQERSHRRRQPAQLHPQGAAQDDKQRRRRHDFPRTAGREQPEHRVQKVYPRHHQSRNRRKTDPDPLCPVQQRHILAPRRKKGDQRQKRHDRQIFQQQDRHDPLPLRRRNIAPLLQHLHHDGGGGQREPRPGDEGTGVRVTQRHADQPQHTDTQQHLQQPKTKDIPPHRPQLRRLHLQPDDEQEHDDAKLRHMQDRHRVREEAKPERTDGQPRREVAQHRPQPDALEDRHCDHRSAEKCHHRDQINARRLRRHALPPNSLGTA